VIESWRPAGRKGLIEEARAKVPGFGVAMMRRPRHTSAKDVKVCSQIDLQLESAYLTLEAFLGGSEDIEKAQDRVRSFPFDEFTLS
jgi:hypothetical protein